MFVIFQREFICIIYYIFLHPTLAVMEGYICIYLTRFLAIESWMQIFIFLKRSRINHVSHLPNIFPCSSFSTENVFKQTWGKGLFCF